MALRTRRRDAYGQEAQDFVKCIFQVGAAQTQAANVGRTPSSQRTSVDLSQHVDLHRGLQNFDKLKDACDLMHLSSIHGELHPTAQCPWMQRPAFHFVLYGCGDFRVLISLARDHYTLIFETTEGGFISINEPPQQSGQMVPPRPRERDICEAFGSRCLDGRRLKAMTDNGKKTAFKELVAEFPRQRTALSHRGGVHNDASHTLQQVAQHLVRFDGASLRWELVNDKDELLWRKFLWERVLQPQTARLYSHLRTDRLKECVLHVRISESMQRFDAAQSQAEAIQSWKSCCESIQQCRHCARQFEGILQAASYSAAQKQLQYHLWSGQWWLNPDEIFFTHARIRRTFRNHCGLDDSVRKLKQNPECRHRYPRLQVLRYHNRCHTVNNRRLYCFRSLQEHFPDERLNIRVDVRAIAGEGNVFKQGRSFLLKFFDAFDSTNDGESVDFF